MSRAWMSRAWHVGLSLLCLSFGAAAAPAALAQLPWRAAQAPRPFDEVSETHKDWKLYCQIWNTPRRLECELTSRTGSDKQSRVVWLRSSERWLDGLRFRLDEAGVDVTKGGIRVWIDNAIFRPEFPCKPFPFEPNTCAVTDPATNQKLVERLTGGAQQVSAVGVNTGGGKAEVRFSLNGFKAAVDRMEQLRSEAGTPWM